ANKTKQPLAVQLRRRVVQQQYRADQCTFRKKTQLSHQKSGCQQFLLTARYSILYVRAIQTYSQLRPLGTHLGYPRFLVMAPTALERLTQAQFPAPPRPIAQMKFHAQQSLGNIARALGKLRNVSDTGVVNVFPESYEVPVPSRHRSVRLPGREG